MSKKDKQIMLFDPQWDGENLVLCFKNDMNFNEINADQFVCDIPLTTAIQMYKYGGFKIKIDIEVQDYLKSKMKDLE